MTQFKPAEIHMRDPFVLPILDEGKYYLYGTGGTTEWNWWDSPRGFVAHTSTDLTTWDGPFPVFLSGPDFWSHQEYWAPEVHEYDGRFYMFATFRSPTVHRGTQILVSDSPLGPFAPHSAGPVTPAEWDCLDGTLYIDAEGIPWIVFCHEWQQCHDGEMHALRLLPDLSAADGGPMLLFRASEAPWAEPIPFATEADYCTDGPYLYRADDGELMMLWSTIGSGGNYTQGVARSESGGIHGPWNQDTEPLFTADGGHGMVFRTFEGGLVLTLHRPNPHPTERPVFLPIEEDHGRLRVVG